MLWPSPLAASAVGVVFLSSWIWEHSKQPLTFESWTKNRPNTKEHNQDDCVLMDCVNHKYEWLDVSCVDDFTEDRKVSFICQKSHIDVETTTEALTTTSELAG